MWVLYGLLPPLLLVALIAGVVAFLMRGRGAEGRGIEFSGVLNGYAHVVMLVAIFLFAVGGAFLVKAGLSGAVGRDFSYDTTSYPYYDPYRPVPEPAQPDGGETKPGEPAVEEPERWIDPSDDNLRDDIATGVTLVFVGAVLFAIHGIGSAVLRRRGAQGLSLVTRAYNMLGLAAATIAFLSAGAAALNDILRRYALDSDVVEPWQERHPGEPLSVAIAMLPLALWFGWRVWQEFTLGEAGQESGGASSETTGTPTA
jgi:hypothetical protein